MHSEPDLLALLALGEPAGTTQEREHLATCAYCTADLAALQRVVGLAREAADVTYVEPAPSVWAAVRAGVRASTKTPETAEPKAYARLTPVLEPWARASGEAELATDGSGRRLLQVTLRADLPATGLRQAWLVDRHDPTQRQSLGVLDGPDRKSVV